MINFFIKHFFFFIKNNIDQFATMVADAILDYIGASATSLYKVKSGDTLYSIAKKYGTTVDKIKKANNITSNTLQIGMSLIIPTEEEKNKAESLRILSEKTKVQLGQYNPKQIEHDVL